MKRLSRPDPSAGEAARLGEQLRDARIALGLSIEDMAASLRIRRVYLAALEEGRVRELPAPAYVLGFVRTYSRALGLDDDDMVRRFREAASATPQRRTDLIFPEPVPERGIPAGVVVMAGVVLVVGAYMAWFQWSGSGTRTVDTVPPMPARLEQAAREAAPALPPGTLPPGAGALIAGAMQSPGLRPNGALPPGPPAANAATAPTAPTLNATAFGAPSLAVPPTPRSDESRIALRAKSDTWVSLRDRATSQSLVNRLLKAGETIQVPPRDGLVLTIGFAAGTEIVVDGLPIPAFPANTSVKRDIPMDPERLKAGNFNPLPASALASGALAVGAEAPAAMAAVAPTNPAPRPAAPRPRPTRPEDRAYEPPQ
jgi:cytoskeleton protein RodZ